MGHGVLFPHQFLGHLARHDVVRPGRQAAHVEAVVGVGLALVDGGIELLFI